MPCAGLGGFTGTDSALLVSVNYFGAVELAVGLRPLLAKAAAAGEPAAVVLLSSNSVTCQPGWASSVVGPCLESDEAKARELAAGVDAVNVYPASKAALAYWARREGVKPEWIGAGIRINAVAPGFITTAMTDSSAATRRSACSRTPTRPRSAGRDVRRRSRSTIAFLLSDQAGLIVGATLFIDGGTDAIMHPMRPEGMNVPPIVMSVASKVAGVATKLKSLKR